MKLLTIPQPRASLLVAGRIVFDTRTAPTDYRGPVAIHAASSLRTELCIASLEEPMAGELKALGLSLAMLPRGAIIATAELVDVVQVLYGVDGNALPPSIMEAAMKELGLGEWQPGRWAYRFERVQAIEPIQGVRGAAFPADMRPELLELVRQAIASAPV